MSSDDDYDFFYDETDDIFEDGNEVKQHFIKVTDESRHEDTVNQEQSLFQSLTTDVVLVNILPFLREKKLLSLMATVSKHFQRMLYSDNAETLWNQNSKPFEFCIDTYCPSCLIKKRQQKGSMHGVLRFFEKCPINCLKLHCFITDIPGEKTCNREIFKSFHSKKFSTL